MTKADKSKAAKMRQMAEESLREIPTRSGLQLSEAEILKLIHELEVHQMELEMQNEELILARLTQQDISNKYIELYDFAPLGYFTLSRKGKIIELNLRGANMLGKERSQLIHNMFGYFVSNDTRTIFYQFLDKIFDSEAEETCEAILSNNGNLPIYVLLTGIVSNGDKQCNITALDITKRKKAEEALRESEEKFRSLANMISQLAWMANADGYIFWYNQRWYDYTGATPEEMEGWGWQSVHDPEWLPEVLEKWKASIAEEKPFEMVFPILGKDGIYRSFLTRGLPLFNNKGKLIQWFGTNTDISKLREDEKKLKEAQRKLELALTSGNVGIWERDLKTEKLVWDKQMEKMFGIEEGTFEGTFEAFERLLVEEDIPHTRKAIRKAEEENVPFETVYRVKLPNGKIKYINAKGSGIQDEEGKTARLAGVCIDITGMKEGAEHALFKLNDELLRSNKELKQFAYVASHDLQEPLRTVSTFIHLLAQRYKDKLEDDAQKFIQYSLDGTQWMQGLIHGLLNYATIGAKAQNFSVVDLNNVFDITISNLKAYIQEKNASVSCDHLPVIVCDEIQLVQLLQNIVENAIKFCDTTPRVHISVKEEADHYLFSVKDNGIGIEQQYSDRIFLMFQRLWAKDQYGGTGIGLAICKRIVELHGGKIYFKSQIGKGTTFYFTIAKDHRI